MPDRYRCILMFGSPGAGKGTQGEILNCIPGFHHLATGDMFRSLDKSSELGRQFLSYSSQGLLVPDDLTIRLWQQHVQKLIGQDEYHPKRDLLVLDGIPRSIQQAHMMMEHIDILKIIHLCATSDEAMIKRMKRRAELQDRPDDADEEVIRKRFEVYREQTEPVLKEYKQERVAPVDALGTPVEVVSRVLQVVAPIYAEHFGNPL